MNTLLRKNFGRTLACRRFFKTAYFLNKGNETEKIDESILQFVVCPLSKSVLRYDKENNELICDKIQVAYPIINGIPNLIPQDARILKSDNKTTDKDKT